MLQSIIFFVLGFYLYKKNNHSKKRTVIITSLFFIYLIFTLMYVGSDYFTNEGINDAVVYHVLYGLDGAGFAEYSLIITAAIVSFIFSFIFSYGYYRVINHSLTPKPKQLRKSIAFVFIFLSFISNPTSQAIWELSYTTVVEQVSFHKSVDWTEEDKDFLSYYKDNAVNEKYEDHPNFIYIYAESLEKTYFDDNIFPGLITGLKEIVDESIEFSNIQQVVGSGWTVGGMTSSQCGIPLFTPAGGNSMNGMEKFYSGARCLGDLLVEDDYYLAYRGGAALKFAGKGKLYTSHGFEDVLGRDELLLRVQNEDYKTNWGLYDDSLFEIVYDDFLELSKSHTKFGLFTLTLDTHHPNGHPSKSCDNLKYQDGSNSILNAVKCSDYLITNLIRKIQSSEYGDNTVIILSSDHLAMRNTATDLLVQGDRKNLLLILDPRINEAKSIKRSGAMLDIGTTIAHILGYDNKIGLGRDLLENNKTLSEEFLDIDKKLLSWKSSIQKFWNFSKLTDTINIDTANKSISISDQKYKFPVLIKIDKDLQTTPYFPHYRDYLFTYLINTKSSTPFIWIDECIMTNTLTKDLNNKFCLVSGTLGGELTSIGLTSTMELSSLNLLNLSDHTDNKNTYLKNTTNLSSLFANKNIIEIINNIPKNSAIYVPKSEHDREILSLYQSISLIPFQDLSKAEEFYFITSDLDLNQLNKTHNIEVIITKYWYDIFRNTFIKFGLYNKNPRGILFKASRL